MKRSGWHIFFQILLWLFTVIAIVGLSLACFAGNIEPSHAKGLSLFILTMPVWLTLWFIITILDALWCRKALVFCILAFIACAHAIWEYFPLNVLPPSEKKYSACPKFTLLTYNVSAFKDLQDVYPGDVNPCVSYIIRSNADIVCLQETDVTLTGTYAPFRITASQIDSINSIYPYRLIYGGYLTLLSKYPAESIHTPPVNEDSNSRWSRYPIGVFRINIEGLPVTLFNVHLRSYGLSARDKALYKNIAEGKEIAEAAEVSMTESYREIKNQIYHKVQDAAEKRAFEANVLGNYIEHFGGPNVIVAGDFNDVPGCYTLRRLDDYDLRQVYPEVGFGPLITFNADLFYFRIDHILYRGNLVPLSVSCGSLKCSDHYPLMATFAVTGNPPTD